MLTTLLAMTLAAQAAATDVQSLAWLTGCWVASGATREVILPTISRRASATRARGRRFTPSSTGR
ncbi:MAG: hypothetical protein AB1635_18305 [Acidobacteriota bacterium]